MEILLSELKSCVGAVIIGFLCLPLHQSASVKSSTAGVLTSTLQSLPPGFFYSALFCLPAQYTPYLLNGPVCTELEHTEPSLLERECKPIQCIRCLVKVIHILHPSLRSRVTEFAYYASCGSQLNMNFNLFVETGICSCFMYMILDNTWT